MGWKWDEKTVLVLCPSSWFSMVWGEFFLIKFSNSAFLSDIWSNSCRVFQFFFPVETLSYQCVISAGRKSCGWQPRWKLARTQGKGGGGSFVLHVSSADFRMYGVPAGSNNYVWCMLRLCIRLIFKGYQYHPISHISTVCFFGGGVWSFLEWPKFCKLHTCFRMILKCQLGNKLGFRWLGDMCRQRSCTPVFRSQISIRIGDLFHSFSWETDLLCKHRNLLDVYYVLPETKYD